MRREAISHSERHEAANNSCLKASVDILWRFTYFSYALFFIGSSSTRHIEEGGGKKKKKKIFEIKVARYRSMIIISR